MNEKTVLPDFRERSLEERLVYLKLLIAFSKIDDDFDLAEKNFLLSLAKRIDISNEEFNELIDQDVTEEEFSKSIKEFKSKNMIYSFFLDLIALTTADGIIQQKEHELLADVCNELGMGLDIMHTLLYFSLSSSYTSLEELFEPIYQSFFNIVLDWIKELKAPVFQQTTFSINPEIDKFLKDLYLKAN